MDVRHHDVFMRTTLTVDDDLSERLLKLARETGQPFKVVVNQALRRGLGELAPATEPFEYQAHAGYLKPGIDPRGLNELAGQLDDEQFVAKQSTTRQ